MDEKVFQSTIYRELSYRFPNKASENYNLYKEVNISKASCFALDENPDNLTDLFAPGGCVERLKGR